MVKKVKQGFKKILAIDRIRDNACSPRAITNVRERDDTTALVVLSCGHKAWLICSIDAPMPTTLPICSQCLDDTLDAVRRCQIS